MTPLLPFTKLLAPFDFVLLKLKTKKTTSTHSTHPQINLTYLNLPKMVNYFKNKALKNLKLLECNLISLLPNLIACATPTVTLYATNATLPLTDLPGTKYIPYKNLL